MDREWPPATRRQIIGASAAGLSAAAGPSVSGQGSRHVVESGASPVVQVADRQALAAHRGVALGSRVVLTEPLRRGTFVAIARAGNEGRVTADPHQAFCVPSAIERDVLWLRDYVGPASLDWGGAQGDGVSDDAPYINAMLQNEYVGWFQVEDGRHHFLASPIRIRRPLKLTGAGIRNSLFSVKASIDVIDASLQHPSEFGITLADFGIKNALPPGKAAAGSGIRLGNAYYAHLSNIRIDNAYNGIHSTRSNLANIDGIHIEGFNNAGFLFDGGENFDSRISRFIVSGRDVGKYAIFLDGMCDEIIFTDGVCSRSEVALYTRSAVDAVNQRPEFCRFSRVSFDSCANGIDLAQSADFVFDACFVSCRPNHGAQIGVRGPVENIQFIATTFFKNGKSALVVGGRASDTDVIGCKFVSNGFDKPNTYDTVVFARGCGPFALSQSRFRQGWGVSSTPRYQVRIEADGDDAYSMVGNHFAPGAAGTVRDDRGGTHRLVSANAGL